MEKNKHLNAELSERRHKYNEYKPDTEAMHNNEHVNGKAELVDHIDKGDMKGSGDVQTESEAMAMITASTELIADFTFVPTKIPEFESLYKKESFEDDTESMVTEKSTIDDNDSSRYDGKSL